MSGTKRLTFFTLGVVSGIWTDQCYTMPNINNQINRIKKLVQENEKNKGK